MEKNNDALFYTCSLIEYIGRITVNRRPDIIDQLGKETVARIYEYADVFHCEPIEKVANDFIEEYEIKNGEFDNVTACKYLIPDYWDIGSVFERLIEDSYEEQQVIDGLFEVYHSWIEEKISDYNTDFYYQSREYIAVCYEEGEVLD
ncbi:hypothetical protein LI177_00050 [bacterium 210820-DFI.6.37]|nr:hypothetical protein [bacterium 210820-DFI.6.37]